MDVNKYWDPKTVDAARGRNIAEVNLQVILARLTYDFPLTTFCSKADTPPFIIPRQILITRARVSQESVSIVHFFIATFSVTLYLSGALN